MRIDGKVVGQDTVRAVSGYFILYVLISLLSILLVSLDGFDGSTTITAVLATFNNIGPGLDLSETLPCSARCPKLFCASTCSSADWKSTRC